MLFQLKTYLNKFWMPRSCATRRIDMVIVFSAICACHAFALSKAFIWNCRRRKRRVQSFNDDTIGNTGGLGRSTSITIRMQLCTFVEAEQKDSNTHELSFQAVSLGIYKLLPC